MQQIEVDQRKRMRLIGWAIVALGVLFVGCWYLWWFPTWTIRVVLPDGYRGQVEIVLDDAAGAETPRHWRTYTYEVPSTGVLRVRDLSPFRQWHNESWTFVDGTSIPRAWVIDSLPLGDPRRHEGAVLVHAGGGDNHDVCYFVGSFSEYHGWEDQRSTWSEAVTNPAAMQ